MITPADDEQPLPGYVVPAGKAVLVPYNGSVARLAFGPLSANRVRRWLKDGAFDVLHVHEPTVPSLPLLACWVASGPIVATVHTAMRRSRVLLATQPVMRSALEKIERRIAGPQAARRRWSTTSAATPCSSRTVSARSAVPARGPARRLASDPAAPSASSAGWRSRARVWPCC